MRLIGAGQAVPDARLGVEDLPLAEALGVAEARDREQALAALGPR